MRIAFYSLLLIFFLLLPIQSHAAEPKVNSIILDAKMLTYDQLSEKEKAEISEYCCIAYLGSRRNTKSFEKEDGYYVRTKINRRPLAYWTFIWSCGKVLEDKKCSTKELDAKMKKAIQDNNPYGLYSKYQNGFEFYNGKKVSPISSLQIGYDILTDKRDKKRQIDELLLGPIPQKPTHMSIGLANFKTDKGKEIKIPQFVVK
jgi:hypothetical protein